MIFNAVIATILVALVGWILLPILIVVLIVNVVRKKRLPAGSNASQSGPHLINGHSSQLVPSSVRRCCPMSERQSLRNMERRLVTAHDRCQVAVNTKLPSELARARVAPVLEEAYEQIRSEIESIYAFCARVDLAGTLKKANTSTSAKDIYLQAYERDLAKVQAAINKTEECLAAYERTIATLETSSVEANIDSDFDASIEMLRDLRDELPLYNLEDRI